MQGRIAILVAIALAAGVDADDKSVAPTSSDADHYFKVEVKGKLLLSAGYEFNPQPDFAKTPNLGAWIGNGTSGAGFEVLIADRKLFDLATANSGKKVIIVGEMQSQLVLPPMNAVLGTRTPTNKVPDMRIPPYRHVICAKGIRVVEQK